MIALAALVIEAGLPNTALISATGVAILSAFAISMALKVIFLLIMDMPVKARLAITLLGVILAGIFWSNLIWIVINSLDISAELPPARYFYLAAIYIFVGWSALFYGILFFEQLSYQNQRSQYAESTAAREQVARLKAESQARAAKLKMLRYQLNPHFLFNSLNAVTALIHQGADQRAQSIVSNLSHFLRYALETDLDVKVTLEQELEALRLYLKVEEERFGKRLCVVFDIDENCLAASVPSLLLQPIAENAIKYAISQSLAGGTLTLSARKNAQTLTLVVADTGADEPVTGDQQTSTGVGITNTTKRLDALYSDFYEFDLAPNPNGGTSVSITLPFET